MAKAKVLLSAASRCATRKKITRTMEMVSTAKYKQSHGRITASAPYQEKLREMMADLAAVGTGSRASASGVAAGEAYAGAAHHVEPRARGGYNSNLIAKAREVVREASSSRARKWSCDVVGKKGILFFRFLKTPLAAAYDHFGKTFGFAEVNEIAEKYIRRYSAGEIDRVTVVFQRYFSAGRQAPVAQVLLPIQRREIGDAARRRRARCEGRGHDAKGAARSPTGTTSTARTRRRSSKELLPAIVQEHALQRVSASRRRRASGAHGGHEERDRQRRTS